MTFAPPRLLEWRSYMRAVTGLDAASLGITGGPGHVLVGTSYHLGKDQLKMQKNPYSARYPRDVNGLSNAASACDTGQFSRLVALTKWCVEQARAGQRPDTRELIGPGGDGRAYRWAVENNWRPELRPDGDDHETHLHEGFWRDSEHRDKVGFYRPFFEGDNSVAINETDFQALIWRVEALFANRDKTIGGPLQGEVNELKKFLTEQFQEVRDHLAVLEQRVLALEERVTALPEVSLTDEQARALAAQTSTDVASKLGELRFVPKVQGP